MANLSDAVRKIFMMSRVLIIIPEVNLEEKLAGMLSKEEEVVNL